MIFYKITYVDNSQIVGPLQEAIKSDSKRTKRTCVKTMLSMNWRSRKGKEKFGDRRRERDTKRENETEQWYENEDETVTKVVR